MLLKFVEQDDSSRKIAALDAISSMALTSDCLSKVQTNKVLAVIPLLLECTTSHAAFLRITPQSPLILLYKCQQKIVNGRTVESIWQMVVEKFKTCEIEDRQIFIESILRGLKLAPAANGFNKVAIQNLTTLAEHVIFDYLSRVDAFKQEVKMPGLNSQFIPPSKEKIDSDIATLLEVGGWLSLLKSATGLLSHVMSIYVTLEPHLRCNTDTLRSRCSALANNLLADNENGPVPYFQRLCGIDIWNSLFRFPDLPGSCQPDFGTYKKILRELLRSPHPAYEMAIRTYHIMTEISLAEVQVACQEAFKDLLDLEREQTYSDEMDNLIFKSVSNMLRKERMSLGRNGPCKSTFDNFVVNLVHDEVALGEDQATRNLRLSSSVKKYMDLAFSCNTE